MVNLRPLITSERELCILDLQASFCVAVIEEFGDNGEETIPREDITECLDALQALVFVVEDDGEIVGGESFKSMKIHNIIRLICCM